MSKLLKCKSCGREIAKGAKCPGCGKDNRNFLMKHKVATVILAIVIIGAAGSSMSNDSNDISKVNTNNNDETVYSNNQEELRNFEVGEIAEKENNYRICVNSISTYESTNQFVKAADGKKYVVANVTVENIGSEKDIVVSSIMCFNLLDLNGVKYDMAITDVGSQLDGTVAPGRKLTGNISYEVPAELTEAELEVNLDVFNGKTIFFKGSIN